MDLQLHPKHIVVLFIWLMLASVTESRIPTIVERPQESECNNSCNNAEGEFCLLGQCIQCGDCPEDPFDLDQSGYLTIYTPCIQNGFCPSVCSSYFNLGSHPRANKTFCENINAPKVTTTQSTTEEVVKTTTTKPRGVTSMKPVTKRVTKTYPVITNIDDKGFPVVMYMVYVLLIILVALLVVIGLKYMYKLIPKRPDSSTPSLTEDTDDLPYKQLEVQLNAENRTATVKGLKQLDCNALQLCACFCNHDYPAKNWIPTGGSDEMQLPGPMIPDQVYTVKAGKVHARNEFECIAEGKVNTEEFSNVTLEDACSTTIKDIFENVGLRKSLEVELLHQRDMIDVIATVFKLTGDSYINFKCQREDRLGKLYNETLTADDAVGRSVHILMKGLVQHIEAKDFVKKIAMRDTNCYCQKCLEFLHRTCCENPDVVVTI